MKRSRFFVLFFCFICCVGVVFSEEALTSLEVMKRARALFSTFELNEQPLTTQQGEEVSNMVQLLLLHKTRYPSGQYLSLLGDGNYYLGNYGEALLFWRCAGLRLPYSSGLRTRISLVYRILEMNSPLVERPVTDFVGLCFLPKTMRYVVLLVVWFFALFFWTFWQWFHFRPLHHLYVVAILFALLLTGGVSWYDWVVPPRVVVLRQTELRGSLTPQVRGTHAEYELSTGEEAEALSFSPDKKWIRIRTGGHQSGYVPGNAVGFIE